MDFVTVMLIPNHALTESFSGKWIRQQQQRYHLLLDLSDNYRPHDTLLSPSTGFGNRLFIWIPAKIIPLASGIISESKFPTKDM